MVRCVISAPKKIITGAFNILFSFSEDVDFTTDDFRIETLSGDPLGDPRDRLKGIANHFMFQCYIPTAKYGKSQVSLDMPGVSVEPVEIGYDTVRVVKATWGTPVVSLQKTDVLVLFDTPLQHLRKRNFLISKAMPFKIYRRGDGYLVSVQNRGVPFSIEVAGLITKASGVDGYIEKSVFLGV